MKTIIAGTDFTPASTNACEYAAFLAQKLNCKLIIFNLFEAPIIHSNVGLYGISYTGQKNESLQRTGKFVKQLQSQFPKISIDYFVTFGGFKRELENFITEHQIEAAVLGLATKSKISKFIFGSHGVELAGKINCPVIIVPSSYKTHKLSKVVLTVDSNEKLQRSTLKGFERFIENSKSKLSLLHVRTEDELFHPIKTTLKINDKVLPIEEKRSKDIQNGVKRYCAINSCDLVAIISKKHSIFYDLFIESHTKKVAFAAKVPVMAIHE
ncbi:MAG: universal stress protein [Bacteroidia bacterium]|nr:universal stress protein [Bacteroidia bacterium]